MDIKPPDWGVSVSDLVAGVRISGETRLWFLQNHRTPPG